MRLFLVEFLRSQNIDVHVHYHQAQRVHVFLPGLLNSPVKLRHNRVFKLDKDTCVESSDAKIAAPETCQAGKAENRASCSCASLWVVAGVTMDLYISIYIYIHMCIHTHMHIHVYGTPHTPALHRCIQRWGFSVAVRSADRPDRQ